MKKYNDYDFVKEHPTLNVERFNNYDIPLDLKQDMANLTYSFVIKTGDVYDKTFVDTIKEYIKKNNIDSATIIDEKSLINTLEMASIFRFIKEKRVDVGMLYEAENLKQYNSLSFGYELSEDEFETLKEKLGVDEN